MKLKKTPMERFNLLIPVSLGNAIRRLAKREVSSASFVARCAIAEYVKREEDQSKR